MKITVVVKPNRKEEKVEKTEGNTFVVWTKMPAKENKANLDVIRQLADYFKIAKSRIDIVSGGKLKRKIIEIAD